MKTNYDDKTKQKAKSAYKKGLTLKEISDKYSIPYSTVRTWKIKEWKDIQGVDGRKDKVAQNAVNSTAPYSNVYAKFMSDEEKAIYNSSRTPEELLQEQINLLTIREYRLMAAINKYSKAEAYDVSSVKITEKSTYKKEQGEKSRVEEYKENSLNALLRLEAELTKLQGKKTIAIEKLAKLKSENDEKLSETVVDDWIAAVNESGGVDVEM